MLNPNHITEEHKTSKTNAKILTSYNIPHSNQTLFLPYKVLNGDHREISVFPPSKQQALHRLTAFVETYYYHISPCRERPDVR